MVDIPYEKQLKMKQKNLQELLSEYGKLEPIIGMEQPDYYRNKVQVPFQNERKGKVVYGFFKECSHKINILKFVKKAAIYNMP